MGSLPMFTIPAVLSYLRIKEAGRCSCISKEWQSCAKRLPMVKMRQEGFVLREQLADELRESIDKNYLESASEGLQDDALKYIAIGAYIDVASRGGWTALMQAAQNGHMGVVKALLDLDAKVNLVSSVGATALILAAARGNAAIAEVLCDHGAILDIVDAMGSTALMCAAHWGRIDVVRVLIAKGAKLDVSTENGGTALHYARLRDHTAVAELLVAAGATS